MKQNSERLKYNRKARDAGGGFSGEKGESGRKNGSERERDCLMELYGFETAC